ncbi:hypothetical protein MNV49_004643 [Pseudohyphozyma bogoriensis]|nr:hypothetical protein MNV49_004643 [Pseudohyphozyma bogoriensis]
MPSANITTAYGVPRPPAEDDGRSIVWFDLDNCVYSKNNEIAPLMKRKIRVFLSHFIQKRYYRDYGLALRGLIRHHQIDPLDYDAKCDASLPLQDILKPRPDLQKLLGQVDRTKFKVWALTNAYKTHAIRVLEYTGIAEYFDGVVSCDYGAEQFSCKPETPYFNEALVAGGQLDPKKCYFVDDSPLNIVAAHALGWGHAIKMVTKIWLDCDPGRDDAIAILLALHMPEVELLGLSSVHGNSSVEHMTYNAVRLLASFGSPSQVASIPVAEGAADPLLVKHISQSSVHGADGLGGVEGLLDRSDPTVAAKLAEASKLNAVLAMADALRNSEDKITLVATGAFTNIALLISMFPALVKEKCTEIVCMGGAEGRGNKSPVAEANVMCDPHAASMVFNFDIKVVICPLNLTHTALFTHDIHTLLLDPTSQTPYSPSNPLPPASTTLRHAISTDLSFFAAAYKKKYNFPAPPCHDALTVAAIAHPELFTGTRYRVDVELNGTHSSGATVVDLWEYKKDSVDQSEDNWGRTGKNVYILESVDVEKFWKDVFLKAVDKADQVCAINKA